MNTMPGNPGAQPGMNLPGMLSFLTKTFGQGSNFQGYMGDSWRASPLGQIFGGGQRQAPGYTPEFGADMPRYLTQQILERQRRPYGSSGGE